MLLVVFHASVALLNFYAMWYDQMYVELPKPDYFKDVPLKARLVFLTFWCLILQTVYFTIAFLNDIIGTNAVSPKRAPIIRKIKDILFTMSFPVALYVSTAFWAIYLIQKELIFPDYIEKIMPSWINHTMHTLLVPFILIELIFTNRNYPTRKMGLTFTLTFNLMYIVWMLFLYFNNGGWPYPLLYAIGWPMKIAFWSCSTIIAVFVYIAGEKLHYMVWPNIVVYSNGVSKSH